MRDPWLPIGTEISDELTLRRCVHAGPDWEIWLARSRERALIADPELARSWSDSGLIESSILREFEFGDRRFLVLVSRSGDRLAPVLHADAPSNVNDALAFAMSLKMSREIDRNASFHDAIYIEQYSRLLPTYSVSPQTDDDKVLGTWLTGGVEISAGAMRRVAALSPACSIDELRAVMAAAGLQDQHGRESDLLGATAVEGFRLPGRPDLEEFFNEHIVDVISNPEEYARFGVEFPGAVLLHGPPGTGKTFAVRKLLEFLDWPSYDIQASSVASPYIHETSRKVAEVFDQAAHRAPAAVVIDEMEAFLPDRTSAGSAASHRVEEVAEFLRRIPEARDHHVLVIGMTNRLEMIDPAAVRRGRFDHVLLVDRASKDELVDLLERLYKDIPTEGLDIEAAAEKLEGRPLSDVAFVVKESARLAARGKRKSISTESLNRAITSLPNTEESARLKPIGFVWDQS